MLYNYSIPANFSQFKKRAEKHKQIPLEESIRQHIFLILVSQFGSNRFSPSYGCALWKFDFDFPSTINRKRDDISKSIEVLLKKHEPRIEDLSISIKVSQEDILIRGFKKISKAKKKISLEVSGRISETNKMFKPKPFVIFFSPMMIRDSKGNS